MQIDMKEENFYNEGCPEAGTPFFVIHGRLRGGMGIFPTEDGFFSILRYEE
jgi:hypothetical protein